MVLVGIDEAGYGPLMGPLCVAMTVFRVPEPEHPVGEDASAHAAKTPNLWTLLSQGVSKSPGRSGKTDAKGRVAIADSKVLKLANSVTTTHPLVHLERGVLTFLRHRASAPCAPTTDLELFDALHEPAFDRVRQLAGAHAAYQGPGHAIPAGTATGALGITANVVGRALATSGVEILDMACVMVFEPTFNATVRTGLNKAEVSGMAVGALFRRAIARFAGLGRMGIVCDRQGGRMEYGPWLERAVPGAKVEIAGEDENRSRYTLHREDLGVQKRAGVAFVVEAEKHHLPVALASMTAKYCRELAMARFNAHWGSVAAGRGVELKPTAGYSTDARRWLRDAEGLLSEGDREALVRVL